MTNNYRNNIKIIHKKFKDNIQWTGDHHQEHYWEQVGAQNPQTQGMLKFFFHMFIN